MYHNQSHIVTMAQVRDLVQAEKVSHVPDTVESNLKYRLKYDFLIATDKDNIDVVIELI